jgi:hypothetical protein
MYSYQVSFTFLGISIGSLLIALFVFGISAGQNDVITECQKYGTIRHDGVVYSCEKVNE